MNSRAKRSLFGKMKESWLSNFLELPNGIPSHGTFERGISLLGPASFLEAFITWIAGVRQLCGDGEVL